MIKNCIQLLYFGCESCNSKTSLAIQMDERVIGIVVYDQINELLWCLLRNYEFGDSKTKPTIALILFQLVITKKISSKTNIQLKGL